MASLSLGKRVSVAKPSGALLVNYFSLDATISDVKTFVESEWSISPGNQNLIDKDGVHQGDAIQLSCLPDELQLSLIVTPPRFSAPTDSKWFDISNNGFTAKKKGTVLWRTIELGSWLSKGQHKASISIDSLEGATVQPPGGSIAFGVIFRSHEHRVNERSGHWSVASCICEEDPDPHGDEYLGNKWGVSYGERLKVGDVVEIKVDMDARILSFSTNGVDQGVKRESLPADGVRMAVALEGGTITITS